MNYDDEWVNIDKIKENQQSMLTNASLMGSGAIFFAGVMNLYIRSLSFLGVFFSSPLLVPFDPVPLILISKKERLRRRRALKKEGELENRDGRLGALLDSKQKGDNGT